MLYWVDGGIGHHLLSYQKRNQQKPLFDIMENENERPRSAIQSCEKKNKI